METISIGAAQTSGLILVTIIGKWKGGRTSDLNKEPNCYSGLDIAVIYGIFIFNGLIVKSFRKALV